MKFFNYLFDFAEKQPAAFTILMAMFFSFVVFVIYKFRIKWKGMKPTFETRDDNELIDAKERIALLEEAIKFSQAPEFYKKTDNGEYIALFIAKKPYIAIWTDGNWNTEEAHQYFDRFDRLWENEDELVIHGRNQLPSDIYHVIDKKIEVLDNLTIFCHSNIGEVLERIYQDNEKVKIVIRN